LRDWPVQPKDAAYDVALKEFVLPYDIVRRAEDPDRTLLSFLQSGYEAAADLSRWDRGGLERPDSTVDSVRSPTASDGHVGRHMA
jgi:hypothetical protein